MLVVLIGLYSDTCKSGVAFYIIRLSQMTVTRRKSAFEQLYQVYLAACHRQCIEIHVMDMYVPFFMGFYMFRVDDIHLVELFCSLRTILEHCPHGGIAVYVGVFTLDLIFLCLFESKVLIYLHELGVHVADPCPLRSVKDVFFGCAGMSVLYQDLFNRILYLLYGRDLVVAHLQQI